MKKALISFIILATQIPSLPACSKSNIKQIRSAEDLSNVVINIVPDKEEAKKEVVGTTFFSRAKMYVKWTWRNKKYIAGGAVGIVAIGLIAWGAAIEST
jgi:hypothetical protein